MTAPSESVQQSTREQCGVGDFVPVDYVPEWKEELAPQTFRPRTFDLSPMISGFGGTLPASEAQTWIFERRNEAGGACWTRIS
ncbi:MAG: hypothetical protein JWO82_219 [Akkermansiaceae bacterium]|nr:hypothetical protein [Akkermansiaceae bacterium]